MGVGNAPYLTAAVEVFGATDGIVTSDWGGSNEEGRAVVRQSDGKLVVTGAVSNQFFASGDVFLARYLVDGRLDPSFGGGDGVVTTDFGTNHDRGESVIQQSDGKLVVRGNYGLVRYNLDGSLDTTFGGGEGIVSSPPYPYGDGSSVIQQADGKLVVVGGYSDFTIVRYNLDGTPDTSFGGGDGLVTTDLGSLPTGAIASCSRQTADWSWRELLDLEIPILRATSRSFATTQTARSIRASAAATEP